MERKKFEETINRILDDFFGVEILFKKTTKILIRSKVESRLKKIARHDMKKLMHIAQDIINGYDLDNEDILFVDIIEEVIHKYIKKEILNIDVNKQKEFFDLLKYLSGETYEGEESTINILLFKKERGIEKDLENFNLELLVSKEDEIKQVMNSKLSLKLLDGKNIILIVDNKLKVRGIARNKNKGIPIKKMLSNKINIIDNTLLRHFFYLYITSLIKKEDPEKIRSELEDIHGEIADEDIREVLELSEELLELDIQRSYRDYRKQTGDFVLIEIENGMLNFYLNNSFDNYLSYSYSKWKYKSFYLFKFLIIERLYKERLLLYPGSNMQKYTSMNKVIDNINVICELLKAFIIEKKGGLILILKEDIEDFEEGVDGVKVEEKLKNIQMISDFSLEKNIYNKIVFGGEESVKITEIHFNFLKLLTSIDGAVILDSSFNLLTFGELVKLDSSSEAIGARTNAAISASKYAIAIKISEDGEITMYDNKKVIIKL